MGNSLIGVFTSRMELAMTELEDLLLRLAAMLTLLLAATLFIALALLFLGLAIVWATPEPYRWIPALGLMALFGLGGAFCAIWLHRNLRDMPSPFAGTRDVLHRDASALRPDAREADAADADLSPISSFQP